MFAVGVGKTPKLLKVPGANVIRELCVRLCDTPSPYVSVIRGRMLPQTLLYHHHVIGAVTR